MTGTPATSAAGVADLLDALPDGIIVADAAGRILLANRQMANLSGYPIVDLVGESIEMLVPQGRRRLHAGHRRQFVETSRGPRPMGTGLHIDLQCKDGSLVPVEIALSLVPGTEGQSVVAAVRDASERRRVEAERSLVQQRLEAIHEVSTAILGGEAVPAVLDLIARQARTMAGADLAAIALPNGVAEELVLVAVDGDAAGRLAGMRLPVRASAAGRVFASGQSWRSRDASAEEDVHRPMINAGRLGPTVVVPLRSGASVLGSMSIARSVGSDDFTPVQVATFEAFAGQAGLALEYSRAREELHRLAVLEDRERIGRELHDGVIQSLFGVGMELQATASLTADATLSARLEKIVGEIDGAIRDVRSYIFGLRPGLLADRQLGQILVRLTAELEQKSGIVGAASVDPDVAARLTPVGGEVVQLLNEALSNVARHSGATTCRVSLSAHGGSAVLVVDDDGHGFNIAEAERDGAGQGLRNLRDRAAALGGSLEIASRPEAGTAVRVTLPLTA